MENKLQKLLDFIALNENKGKIKPREIGKILDMRMDLSLIHI